MPLENQQNLGCQNICTRLYRYILYLFSVISALATHYYSVFLSFSLSLSLCLTLFSLFLFHSPSLADLLLCESGPSVLSLFCNHAAVHGLPLRTMHRDVLNRHSEQGLLLYLHFNVFFSSFLLQFVFWLILYPSPFRTTTHLKCRDVFIV